MAQITRKWIADKAIDGSKLDNSASFTMAQLTAAAIGVGTSSPQDEIHVRSTAVKAGLRLELADGLLGRTYRTVSNSSGQYAIIDGTLDSTRVIVDASGSVGIGTAPGAELHVYKSYGDAAIRVQSGAGVTANYKLVADATNGRLVVYDVNASQPRMTVDATGSIGIGTTDPKDDLHIYDTPEAGLMLDSGAGKFELVTKADGQFYIRDSQTALDRLYIDTNGNLHVNKDTTMSGGLQVNGTTTIVNQKVIISDRLEVNGDGVPDSTVMAVRQLNAGATSRMMVLENAGTGAALTVAGTGSNNVGIGTTNPVTILQVVGVESVTGSIGVGTTVPSADIEAYRNSNNTARVLSYNLNSGTASSAAISADNDFGNTVEMVSYSTGNTGAVAGLAAANVGELGSENINGFILNQRVAGPMLFATNSTVKMTILSGGNVGIGTTNPTVDLHIEKSSATGTSLSIKNTSSANTAYGTMAAYSDTGSVQINSYSSTSTYTNGGLSDAGLAEIRATTTSGLVINSINVAAPIYFSTTNTVRMTILDSGYVGIGTTIPSTLLNVEYNAAQAAILANNASTSGSAIGIKGHVGGNGTGLSGDASGGIGILGQDLGAGYGGQFSSNTGTGIRVTSTSGDVFRAYAGSFSPANNKVVISSSGFIGVGSTVPGNAIDIKGAGVGFIYGVSINNTSTGLADAAGLYMTSDAGTSTLSQASIAGGSAASLNAITGSLYLATSNVVRLAITNSGYVGIGDTNPGVVLDAVVGSSIARFKTDTTSGSSSWYIEPITGKMYWGKIGAGTYLPAQFYVNNAEQMRITTAGFVGIGDTNPSGALEVVTGAGIVRFKTDTTTGSSTWYVQPSNGSLIWGRIGSGAYYPAIFNVGGSEKMRIDTAGNVGIGDSNPGVSLDVVVGSSIARIKTDTSSGSSSWYIEPGTGKMYWGRIGAGTYLPAIFYTNNSEQMRIDTLGNVGIGITNPTSILHVDTTNAGPFAQFINHSGSGGAVSVTAHVEGNGTAIAADSSSGIAVYGHELGSGNAIRGRSTSGVGVRAWSETGHPFEAYTGGGAGTVQVTIDENGYLGIGTTSPMGPIDVQDNNAGVSVNIDNASTSGAALGLAISVAGSGTGIAADSSGGLAVYGHELGSGNAVRGRSTSGVGVRAWSETGHPFEAYTGGGAGSVKVTIDENGRVGVGTTAPDTAVHVYNGAVTFGGVGGPQIIAGTGIPALSLPNGSLFLRTDGGAGTTLYVRESGSWVAK